MSKRGDKEYLTDILIACENILLYIEGYDFNLFMNDRKTQDAIIRNIEIIGEAVKNISKSLRNKYQKIEWNEIAKTRDKLIHSYFGVDLDIVWDIINFDILKLKKISKKLSRMKNGNDTFSEESLELYGTCQHIPKSGIGKSPYIKLSI